jgi:excisionase family DNA binding protein
MTMVVNLADYVTTTEAARLLGINYPALWARIDRGHVSTLRVGRSHMISREEIKRLRENSNDPNEGLGQAAR